MPKRRRDDKLVSKARVDEPLRTIYRKLREEFTAADLAEYTEIKIEEGIPFEQVLAELEKPRSRPKRKRRK